MKKEKPYKTTVKRTNFESTIPDCVKIILSVSRKNMEIPYVSPDWNMYSQYNIFCRETWTRHGNRILFSGSLSRWFLVRVVQIWIDKINPCEYDILYFDSVLNNNLHEKR